MAEKTEQPTKCFLCDAPLGKRYTESRYYVFLKCTKCGIISGGYSRYQQKVEQPKVKQPREWIKEEWIKYEGK